MTLHPLQVTRIVHETPDAFSIHFKDPGTPEFRYKPGQYLTLHVVVNGKAERRAFSLSSSPTEKGDLAVTIKCLQGGVVSNHLRDTLQVGDTVQVLPPLGKFCLDLNAANQRHYVLIAGGSGITPVMSMLRSVLATEPQSKLTLLYGNRDSQHTIFLNEIQALAKQYADRFHFDHICSEPEAGWQGHVGIIAGQLLTDLLSAAFKRHQLPTGYYMCGPNPMMENVKALLHLAGVQAKDIHQEYYTAPIAADSEEEEEEYELVTQTIKMKLDGRMHSVTVQPDKSILDAAIDIGLDPPYACQEGVCCTCRARLHSGLVQMDEREGLSDEEIEAGYILTCQSHPLTDDVYVEFG